MGLWEDIKENRAEGKIMAELIMTVGFIFNDDEKGKRIAGAAESHYSTDDLRWLNFSGKKVLIKTKKENLYFKVKKIDVFPSISGAINIGLTLDEDVQFDAISIGDQVFKISDVDTDRIAEDFPDITKID